MSLSSLVTGLLIGLILDPVAGIRTLFIASLVASLSKYVFRLKTHRHLLNPACLGIVFATLLFRQQVSWWAVSWGVVPVVILSVGMLPVLLQLKRHFMPISFLFLYFLSFWFTGGIHQAIRLTVDGTVFLFATVMLPEPKTSVTVGYWRYTWGLLVAGLVAVESELRVSVTDPLLLALLIANLIGFVAFKILPRSA